METGEGKGLCPAGRAMEAVVEVGLSQGCLSWFGGTAQPSAWPISLSTNGACGTIHVLWASGVMNSGFRNF